MSLDPFRKCGDLEDCPMGGERGQTAPLSTQPQDCHDPEHAAGKLSGVSADRQTGRSHSGREGFPSLLFSGLPLSPKLLLPAALPAVPPLVPTARSQVYTELVDTGQILRKLG